MALRVVCVCDTVDDLLCLVAGDLLVVGLDVAQVVATAVVRFAYAHTVVCEVHIAVVAEELRHCDDRDSKKKGGILVCVVLASLSGARRVAKLRGGDA